MRLTKGILRKEQGQKYYQLSRTQPPHWLKPFVDLIWIVHWDLPEGKSYLQENIPDPCMHLTVEKGRSQLFGVIKGRFSQQLKGKGRVVGVKFRPGGFYPFVQTPMVDYADRWVSYIDVLGEAHDALEDSILSLSKDQEEQMRQHMYAFLRRHLPQPDPKIAWIEDILTHIRESPDVTRVDDLCTQCGVQKRTLQRLFSTYIGASPKWLIRLTRIQEAVACIQPDFTPSWSDLALSLGYFDQAHFIRDFKQIVGLPPQAYQQKYRQELEALHISTDSEI